MQVYHTETTIAQNGLPVLGKLPFVEGEAIEVIIKPIGKTGHSERTYPFRGTPLKYIDPFEPVFPETGWDALNNDPS